MCPDVTYTPCDTSSKGENVNIIMFAQFEEVNILTKTRNDVETCDRSYDNSIIPPLLIKEEIDAIDSVNESDHILISTEMLEYIPDGSQSHLIVNQREACYKIRDCIRQRQSEWKGALKATRSMGKDSHKVFSMFVIFFLQELTPLGESGSEVSHFIP